MKYGVFFAFVALAAASCGNNLRIGDFSVSPIPENITLTEGKPFEFGDRVVIQSPDELGTIAGLLASDLEEALGKKPEISGKKGNIILATDSAMPKEGYRIECGKDALKITGGSPAGVLYGAKTVYKALPSPGEGRAALPAAVVEDSPEYPYRGFMVDVARHFFTVDYLKELIDIMSLHGINVFHWHLTDDQGWRVPVPGYPKLTEVGSFRPGTIVAPGSELEVLVHHADAQTVGVVGVVDLDDLAVLLDDALLRLVKAEEHAHQGRFACAVFAEQRVDLALSELQSDIIVGDNTGESLGDIKHLDCVVILQALPPPVF